MRIRTFIRTFYLNWHFQVTKFCFERCYVIQMFLLHIFVPKDRELPPTTQNISSQRVTTAHLLVTKEPKLSGGMHVPK